MPERTYEQGKKGWYSGKAYDWIGNIGKNILKKVPGKKIKQLVSLKRRRLKGQRHPVRDELEKWFDKDNGLIVELKKMEQDDFAAATNIVFGEGGQLGGIVGEYKQLGYYTNPDIVDAELGFFKLGTKPQGTIIQTADPAAGRPIPTLEIGGQKIPHDETYTEELTTFGYEKLEEYNKRIGDAISTIVEQVTAHNTGDRGTMTTFTEMLNELQKLIEKVKRYEEEYYTNDISRYKEVHNRFGALRDRLFKSAPGKVRFKHTYLVAKRFIISSAGKVVTFEDEHSSWETKDGEIGPGLDEFGWPLEVDKDGNVLLDIWWKELRENDWQREMILGKINDAKNCGFVKERLKDTSAVRKIKPGFIGQLDLMETGIYLSNEWDSYRDDFRDGRYHPHSKTVLDYCIAADHGVIPKSKIILKLKEDELNGTKDEPPLTRQVDNTKKIKSTEKNGDEKRVNGYRTFRWTFLKDEKFDYAKINAAKGWKVRKPSHLSPAFDRNAVNSDWMHWGRMYYYNYPDAIKEWSENPAPFISTRGIAKYLIDRVVRDCLYFEDAVVTMQDTEQGYDYGVREFGIKGRFTKNPLGGEILYY